jgi:hypothetical protein
MRRLRTGLKQRPSAERTAVDPSIFLMSTRKKSGKEKPQNDDAAKRLAKFQRTKGTIPYHVDLPDKEYAYIKCSIYGVPRTNELFVKLTNGKVTFVEAIKSDLSGPAMADRIFGMDVMDSNDAFSLVERMWKKHKKSLILDPDRSRPSGG